jgi:hypothetical protein
LVKLSVLEICPGVETVKPGDLVVNLMRGNWTQKRQVRGEDIIRLPEASICDRPLWSESIRLRNYGAMSKGAT